jgi:hypothetical protein
MRAKNFSFSNLPRNKHGHRTVSTERAQHTEIPLPQDKTPLDTRQVRQCSFCRARQHDIDFARKNKEHYLRRQPCAFETRL